MIKAANFLSADLEFFETPERVSPFFILYVTSAYEYVEKINNIAAARQNLFILSLLSLCSLFPFNVSECGQLCKVF